MAHKPAEHRKRAFTRALISTSLLLAFNACSDKGNSDFSNAWGGSGPGPQGGAAGNDASGGLNSSGGNAGSNAVGGAASVGKDSNADARAFSDKSYATQTAESGAFPLVQGGVAAQIVVSDKDFAGVVRVASDLRDDIQRVSNVAPTVVMNDVPKGAKQVVIVGTVGKSPLIEQLVTAKKLDLTDFKNAAWENFVVQTVDKPMEGVDQALVIVGSDQRGTIYGAYDVSKQIGVSPWYWWNDVPPKHASSLYIRAGRYSDGSPAVKYRGFFINDENPQTGNWAPQIFGPGMATITRAGTNQMTTYTGGLNHRYWEKIFELALRIRANYIWPAVWGRAFADDDPQNHATASKYGVVMGTSHEAPMLRGIEEWNRRVDPTTRKNAGGSGADDEMVTHEGADPWNGNGEWRFSKNPDALKAYWKEGIKRMVDQKIEGVVTLGMRGPGDVKLPADTGTALMQQIIDEQRKIITEVTGQDASKTPQVWTLYKEVEDWYDQGLRAPDDVTVVWCDDNWGNMRELPLLSDKPRAGGYGIYYHFDYVGGGRNYKWVDTNLLPNLWEQLNLSYSYGVDRLWMFNVGDMKGNEVPLEFAMDYAWNPKRMPIESIPKWEQHFASEQFGTDQAAAIANILSTYQKLQSDRKPELLNRKITLDPMKDPAKDGSAILYSDQLYFAKDANGMLLPPDQRTYYDANPFSLTNYGEMERVVNEWQTLAARAETVSHQIADEQQDAYFQLVLYNVKATATLYALRLAEYQNILYAAQGRSSTNDFATLAQGYFDAHQELATQYNTEVANGKWAGWQSQPHIDYGDVDRYGNNASWQQPEMNNLAIPDIIFPALRTATPVANGSMGVAIDGSTEAWPASMNPAVLPNFSPYQTQPAQYIEVFNKGNGPFDFAITVDAPPGETNGAMYSIPWINVTPSSGHITEATKQVRVKITVDWAHAPSNMPSIPVTFTVKGTDDGTTTVPVKATIDLPKVPDWMANRFVEANGVVSMEASHFNRNVSANNVGWTVLPGIGKTGDGVTPWPVTAPTQTPGDKSPHLEYDFYSFGSGDVSISAYLSPRNSVLHNGDIKNNIYPSLKYGISVDDGPIQTVSINEGDQLSGGGNKQWERHTSDNINLTVTKHNLSAAGQHVLKFWMVDPTVIAQKFVVNLGGQKDSYFGPPESYRTHD